MATTSRPIEFLVTGIRDSSGNVVASGKVRWYNPGTLVAATVYSDAACTTPISAPLTLNAAGQGTIYCLEPVRVIVKDSTETVSYYDDIAPLNRHDSVYLTHPNVNGGVETTLEAFLGTLTTNLGVSFLYKESSGATARTYTTWLGELAVSVKDFGAQGDGTTDDTAACQAASDRVEARGGGWVLWPKGTYKITSPIAVDTVGVNHMGAGRGISVIKNFSTTGNAFSVNVGSAIDSKLTIKDLSITANTTSSGKGIVVTNGNRVRLERVAVALHRTGIDVSAVTEAVLDDCLVESTDDNAAAGGLVLGLRGRALFCNVISGTTNGKGISLAGTDAICSDCYVEKFATGVGLDAAATQARACRVISATLGYGVGAFARCGVPFCKATTCTTDLSVNTAATFFDDRGHALAGTTTYNAATPAVLPFRTGILTQTLTATGALTPDISGGNNVQLLIMDTASAAQTMTVNAHATTNLSVGDIMWVIIAKKQANTLTVAWNAQYKESDGVGNIAAPTSMAAGGANIVVFQWTGTVFANIFYGGSNMSIT